MFSRFNLYRLPITGYQLPVSVVLLVNMSRHVRNLIKSDTQLLSIPYSHVDTHVVLCSQCYSACQSVSAVSPCSVC